MSTRVSWVNKDRSLRYQSLGSTLAIDNLSRESIGFMHPIYQRKNGPISMIEFAYVKACFSCEQAEVVINKVIN